MDRRHEARDAAARRLWLEVVAAQRREAIRLRDQGVINEEVLYRIEREFDLEELWLGVED